MARALGLIMALTTGGGSLFLVAALVTGGLPEPATGITFVDQGLGFLAAARDVLGPILSAFMVLVFGGTLTVLCLAPPSSGTGDGAGGLWFDGDGCGGDGD